MSEYNANFETLKKETDQSLAKLVNLSCEYNEATYQIVQDYKRLVENLDKKINETKERNDKILMEKESRLEEAKKKEDEHKLKLEEKVKDSDKLIEKNVEIKQNIINATQRTITFQEQLLETEKNLVKIDKKLEDLVVKNKHLEQIRFVLEHRMTSLEKEKAPLEGQCSFLENQKNKLTDEFNKIILQINKNNQDLENKQSQLRASLIQNYEIHDQKNYVEAKLIQLKTDIEQFLQNYQERDDEKPLNENKATKVALNFKHFYDKYFSNSIEDELLNYQYYSQKLQEQTDKDGIANNFDLIMRNKAEEKLICEKEKVEELKQVKENGFKRIQNENTILITECNRLRKSLHEIYMHVIDIEQRFEQLTNINPKLSKSDIVGQIKEFIRITHEKIKLNYASNKKNGKIKTKKIVKSQSMKKIINDKDFNKLIEKNINKKLVKKGSTIDINKNGDYDDKNPYVNIIKFKQMKKKGEAFIHGNNRFSGTNIFGSKIKKYNNNQKGALPYIGNK
jgi:DNA repair exonuclease SbcCD ATPase subunit